MINLNILGSIPATAGTSNVRTRTQHKHKRSNDGTGSDDFPSAADSIHPNGSTTGQHLHDVDAHKRDLGSG